MKTFTAEQYHLDPAPGPSLSNSLIPPLLTLTPKHAWLQHPKLNPDYAATESEKFDAGKAAHSMLLEGIDRCAVIDADDWRTNKAKALRDAARAEGKTPLLFEQHKTVKAMVDAARAFIDTTPYKGVFERGLPEQTLIWQEKIAGKPGPWCRARLDMLDLSGGPLILDYKTTGVKGGPAEFCTRQMIAHGYDTQSVFYRRGLAALGHGEARFVFLVQEDEPPFMCYLAELAESFNELAGSKVRRALGLWHRCVSDNHWPGYPESIYQFDAPVWALKEEQLA